jgi:MoaA/NifB/PqqE/SkfB family radical SAM enzyme
VAESLSPTARLRQVARERAQPLSASLELTYRCNWRCVFCYNPRHHDRWGLDGDEWLGVLDELRVLGTLYVTLTGGEALAHSDFLRIARGVRERSLALRILTNGSLVTEHVADEIRDLRPMGVEMSLHGARSETHDRTTGTPGSFDAMLRGLDRLRARAVSVLLKTPLTRLNETELDAMRVLAEERQVPWRVDSMLSPRDDGDPSPLAYRASPEAVERMFRVLRNVGQLPHEERVAGGTNCGLGRTTLAVDPEGDVFPCLQWRRAPLGNVRRTPLRELWAGSSERLAAAAVAGAANDRMVQKGGALASFPFCPALALQRTGDPLRPDADHREHAETAARVRALPA